MLLAGVALLAALWAGLIRIGWQLPSPRPGFASIHGPLMVSGFLGSLIGLERAVARSLFTSSGMPFIGPVITGVAAALLLVVMPGAVVPALMAIGSLLLSTMFASVLARQQAFFIVLLFLGSLAWLAGNFTWLLGRPIPHATWFWCGFLLLTIAGERLELSRITTRGRFQKSALGVSAFILILGMSLAPFLYDRGVRLFGLGAMLLAAWLLYFDVARITVRRPGQIRFTAICLLSGYFWLLVGGGLSVWSGGVTAGPRYDAILHAIFLGFGFSLIFGHAPIIFPSLIGKPMAFRMSHYAPFVLLHASLTARLAGDLLGVLALRQWGGLINVVALIAFFVNTGYSLRRGQSTSV